MPIGPSPEEIHFSQQPDVTGSIPGSQSKNLLDQQAGKEAGTVAYPLSLPIAIDSARGATVKDVDGNIYLDFSAGIGSRTLATRIHTFSKLLRSNSKKLHTRSTFRPNLVWRLSMHLNRSLRARYLGIAGSYSEDPPAPTQSRRRSS